MRDLMAALPQFDFVFANAPEDGGVWMRDPPGGKGDGDKGDTGDTGDKDDTGDWGDKEDGDWGDWDGDKEDWSGDKEKWNGDKEKGRGNKGGNKGRGKGSKKSKQAKKGTEPTTDEGWADLSVSYLDGIVSSQGPFYALLGYSQGSAMIPVFLAKFYNHPPCLS